MAKKAKKTKAKKTKAKAGPAKKTRPAKKKTAAKAGPAKSKTVSRAKAVPPRGKPSPNDAGLAIVSVSATANLMPPGPSHFYVRSRIQAPTRGYTAYLQKAVPQGINPRILILDVVLVPKPGTFPDVVSEIGADYDDRNYRGNYTDVTVRYGSVTKSAKVQIVV